MMDWVSANCFKCASHMTIHKNWATGPSICDKCSRGDNLGLDRFRYLPTHIRKEGCVSCGHKRLKLDINQKSFYITSSCPKCSRVRKYGIMGIELGMKVITDFTPFLEEVDI